ncbi:DUF488 family protein [Phenylobacterium sp.]|uniref:DUF488 domain-containing protein n=1 Tax=Phenylobacterium sp. TaxID=1871053 RepID=UPI003BAAA0D2
MLNTIGYEGARPEDLIRTLQAAGISVLFDVRDRAQSRRPGFSKSALSQSLADAGIAYVHYRELGDPKEGREAARAGDIVTFRKIFAAVLERPDAVAAVAAVADASTKADVCMLCYERDPGQCHRTLIADKIETITGQKTRHLGVRRFEPSQQQEGRVRYPCESAAA